MNNQSSFICSLKYILLSIFILFFSENCLSQPGWYNQNSGVTNNLTSASFINSNTGWCAGNNGTILKTTNGGDGWILKNSGVDQNINSLMFTSIDTGYAVGVKGLILKSTNGGDSWLRLNVVDSTYDFSSVYFVNNSLGYLGGAKTEPDPAKILRTSNGGIDWDFVEYQGAFIKSIFFINNTTGWIINGHYVIGVEEVKKTTNGGSDWETQYGTVTLNSLFFLDTLVGWTVGLGTGPSIFKTINGGNIWTPCLFCGVGEVNSVFFANYSKGWLTGRQYLYSTTNGGNNWILYPDIEPTKFKRDIKFTDSLTGWVVGDSGIILKTTTGGVLTDFTNISSEIPDEYSLSQNYPNPFNPRTIINYQLSMFNFVSLKVYDVLGNEVAVLVNEKHNAGAYSVEFDGSGFSSGVYYYRLETAEFRETKSMVLLK
ncbi:MAG: T9SS type A sorting domain-containing protein [Ignavibacteria bacterium]|nr:T9SS type A sorting domain-containing protein [Ignavibacteria bacterium]